MKTETMLFVIAVFAILVMGILLAIVLFYPAGVGQGTATSGQSYISVSATGSASASPELASISVTMNGTGSTSTLAVSNLSFTLTQFNNSIAPYIGKNYSKVSTQYYSVSKYNRSMYAATEQLSVSIPQVSNVSPALGSLSQISNVYVQGVSTQLSAQQVQTLQQQALSLAIANATHEASAAAPNRTLTIRNITIAQSYIYPRFASSSPSAYQNPLYFSGTQSVTETATVVFWYK